MDDGMDEELEPVPWRWVGAHRGRRHARAAAGGAALRVAPRRAVLPRSGQGPPRVGLRRPAAVHAAGRPVRRLDRAGQPRGAAHGSGHHRRRHRRARRADRPRGGRRPASADRRGRRARVLRVPPRRRSPPVDRGVRPDGVDGRALGDGPAPPHRRPALVGRLRRHRGDRTLEQAPRGDARHHGADRARRRTGGGGCSGHPGCRWEARWPC